VAVVAVVVMVPGSLGGLVECVAVYKAISGMKKNQSCGSFFYFIEEK
jgi:hypothetical protein